ncbi:cadherin-like domain-containing protein [Pleionea sediminis]|uniref:cadherin-like domain-containing protein n=1 Tax=Pleionea sediminis TaxID=2569479 RepID=UPI0011847138|nr:cadherin-like domain-containing protein [Pleionea sediminis]
MQNINPFIISFILTFLVIPLKADEHCEIYPITVSQELFEDAEIGDKFKKIKAGDKLDEFDWLTWDGDQDKRSLEESLIPPGNSEIYINPDDFNDTVLSIGDFVQSREKVKKNKDAKERLEDLEDTIITIPVWSNRREVDERRKGKGKDDNFDYQIGSFANIQLTKTKMKKDKKGKLDFIYLGPTECNVDQNVPPIAVGGSYEGKQDEIIIIFLVANDPDGDPITYSVTSEPQNGTLIGSDFVYLYVPNPGFSGNDSFNFVANDGQADSNTATIFLNITSLNNAPVAEDIQINGQEDSQLTFTVNVIDLDNDPLTFAIVSPPQNGTLSGAGPNFIYTPDSGFVGQDTFTFVANDGVVNSNVATATIVIASSRNTAPVIESDQFYGFMNEPLEFTVEAFDPENDELTYRVVAPPYFGTITGEGPTFTYTPNQDFFGTDLIEIVASDGQVESNIGEFFMQILSDE